MNWNLRLPSYLLGFLMPLNQQEEETIVPSGMSGLVYQEKLELRLHSGGEKDYIWNPEDSWECPYTFCPVVLVDGKLRQFDKDKTSENSDLPSLRAVRG